MKGTEQIYRLDTAAVETLTEQLSENLRRAIANGLYKPGDRLPGIREMAKLCGTSGLLDLLRAEKATCLAKAWNG